ncbi:hypothetical protein CVT24_008984 [Panaeolus cyanescens]|uniref:F-box domain-containing protein n=1 Tax=Panaeolus cyanescens TaxID=181874 RepID=A0A409YAQ6_9AGAR|nr:hypothetical protein CVT24_008984 [Panaeolus cyanescens]
MMDTDQTSSSSPIQEPSLFSSNIFEVVPVEIWQQIFLQLVPSPSHFKHVGFNTTEFIEFDPKPIIWLSHVSQYLRQVAISCPSLWTCIPTLKDIYRMPEPSAVKYFDKRFNLVNLFIERSQNQPIHVTLSDGEWGYALSQGLAGFNSIAGRASFFATSDRWKSLTIVFVAEYVLEKYARDIVLRSPCSTVLPILDTLAIRQHKETMTHLNPLSVFKTAPMLKHIHFIGMDIDTLFHLPWNQITSYNGALMQFSHFSFSCDTLESLVLKRNIQFAEIPPTVIRFTKLTRMVFDNVDYMHKLPRFYTSRPWPDEGTALQRVEAPILQSLEITTYQALKEAPSIVGNLRVALLRLPHEFLRHITFHVGGLTRQALSDLLRNTSNLESLDLWGVSSEVLCALKVESRREGGSWSVGTVLAPQLRALVVREWKDGDCQSLLDIFDSRRSEGAIAVGCYALRRIDLVYKKHEACRRAQDRIEGWGDERAKVYTPGSEYQKVHGFASHLAKEFLLKDEQRDPRFYGVRRPQRGHKGDPRKFLQVVGLHGYSDLNFVEISRLRAVLQDIHDQHQQQSADDRFRGSVDIEAFDLLSETADSLLRQWNLVLRDRDLARRWKLTEDRLTLRLER